MILKSVAEQLIGSLLRDYQRMRKYCLAVNVSLIPLLHLSQFNHELIN